MSLRPADRITESQPGGESILGRARSALAGGASPFSAAEAIEVIASSSFANRHRDLELVLTDSGAPSRVRMRAAMALARCEREVARDVLQAAVKIEDQVVLVGVMRALGMVGGSEALQAIDDVIRKLDARARNQAEFARTLIAHRLGRPDAHGPYAPAGNLLEPAADSGRRLRIRPARPSAVERLLTSTGSSLYGIEVDDEAVLEYSCDRASGAILLNRALTKRDAINELRARPAILGLEARRDLASGEYSVSAVILTAPSGDAVDIAVHLTNGTLLFTGRAE